MIVMIILKIFINCEDDAIIYPYMVVHKTIGGFIADDHSLLLECTWEDGQVRKAVLVQKLEKK